MQNELFNQLLSEGKLGVILENGGANLTTAQIQKVKEAAKEQANMTLEEVQRNADILHGIRTQRNVRSSDVMNDYTGNLKDKFEPQRIAKAMDGSSKLKGKTNDEMQEEPEEEKYEKRKDPSISKVAPSTHLRLKKGDSEADILAKMLNLINENYVRKNKSQLKSDKMKMEIDKKKEMQNKTLLHAFGYKKDKKTDETTHEFNWLKVASIGAIAGFGLLGAEEAHAKFKDVQKIKFPTIDELLNKSKEEMDKVKLKIPSMGDNKDNIEFDFKEFPFKSDESIAGGPVAKEIVDVWQKIKKSHPDAVITAGNDLYHRTLPKYSNGKLSLHTEGTATDIVMDKMSKEGAENLQKELGNNTRVTYEPPDLRPNSRNKSGHYHIETPNISGEMVNIVKVPVQKKTQEPTMVENVESKAQENKTKLPEIVKKPYALQKSDEVVKEAQDTLGESKKPNVIVINETTNIKQSITKMVDRINTMNKEHDIAPALIKQTGLNINMLQYN